MVSEKVSSGSKMALFWSIFLIVIFIVFFIVAGVYATKATLAIRKSTDANLKTAHKYLVWATSITWVTVGIGVLLVIGLIVLLVFGGAEVAGAAEEEASVTEASEGGIGNLSGVSGFLLKLGLYSIMLLSLSVGILSAISAYYIYTAPTSSTGTGTKPGYTDAVIAAIVAIAPVGIFVVWQIVEAVHSRRKKKQVEEGKEKIRKELIEDIEVKRLSQKKSRGEEIGG